MHIQMEIVTNTMTCHRCLVYSSLCWLV